MNRFRITYVDLDGATQTETVAACDAAAALGVLLDEHEVDEREPIQLGPARARRKKKTPRRKPVSSNKVVPIERARRAAATTLPAFLENLV